MKPGADAARVCAGSDDGGKPATGDAHLAGRSPGLSLAFVIATILIVIVMVVPAVRKRRSDITD
jgi:hypothetical protein